MNAILKMRNRILKSILDLLKVFIKSLSNTTVQVVLGMIIVLYTSFLESDKESVLSILMNNALGRVIVMSILALLSIAAPPVGILFGVLIVMSYNNSNAFSGVSYNDEHEGFWVSEESQTDDNTEDKEATTKESSDMAEKEEIKQDDTDIEKVDESQSDKTLNMNNISDALTKMIGELKPDVDTNDEGFGLMYEMDDNESLDYEEKETDINLGVIGNLSGYNTSANVHSSV